MRAIVAVDAQNAIGWSDGRIPWHVPEDMKRFKALTSCGDEHGGRPTVVMGRKTYETLSKPLPNRRNVVVTGNEELVPKLKAQGFLPAVGRFKSSHYLPTDWLIGGAQLYNEALDQGMVTELHITQVHRSSGADVTLSHDLYSWKLFAVRELAKGRSWLLLDSQALEDSGVTFLTLIRTSQ